MNIFQPTIVLFAAWCISCANHKEIKETKTLNRDSLLLTQVCRDFNVRDATQESISSQLTSLRDGPHKNSTYANVTEGELDDFRLRAYRFDTQGYPPFIIEIADSNNDVISLFTYTDELYYLDNKLSSEVKDSLAFVLKSDTGTIDSSLAQKLTLDRELNELIVKLKIKGDLPKISRLINVIFQRLLRLDQYDDEEIKSLLKQIKASPEFIRMLESEFRMFQEDESLMAFRFKANEGVFGYWKLLIISETNGYRLKSKFFSDVLYTAAFL